MLSTQPAYSARDTADKTTRAPDIDATHWFNVTAKTFGDLTEKIVVVNFWSFSCHHSQSMLRQLSVLNRNFKRAPFQLISVHTPKLAFEADVNSVARAVKDYRITWPVAVDSDRLNYNAFEIKFWPTCILIDKDGVVRGRYIGAGGFAQLARDTQALLLK